MGIHLDFCAFGARFKSNTHFRARWSEYGKIEFEEKAEGVYALKSGKKLNMKGIIWNLLPLVIKVNGNIIEFDGKELGKIELFE